MNEVTRLCFNLPEADKNLPVVQQSLNVLLPDIIGRIRVYHILDNKRKTDQEVINTVEAGRRGKRVL